MISCPVFRFCSLEWVPFLASSQLRWQLKTFLRCHQTLSQISSNSITREKSLIWLKPWDFNCYWLQSQSSVDNIGDDCWVWEQHHSGRHGNWGDRLSHRRHFNIHRSIIYLEQYNPSKGILNTLLIKHNSGFHQGAQTLLEAEGS